MLFWFLWIVLVPYSHGHSAYSFARVLRVSVTEYTEDVLTTYSNTTNYVGCARVCKTDCVSFTYDTGTKECKTFSRMMCQNDDATTTPNVLMFAKLGLKTNSSAVDCRDVNQAVYCSGVYRITPTPGVSFDMYCDMDTENGPWTVIQNRQNGDEEFFRPWSDYKKGFGNLRGNFWLGNDAIHHLTVPDSILRIELVSWLGDYGYAQYSTFRVGNETDNYRLTVSGFSGNLTSNCMAIHNEMLFSTYDRDNDRFGYSCASAYKGGWWYNSCFCTNLNGQTYMPGHGNTQSAVWDFFYPDIRYTHMKTTRMLVKRLF